MKLSTTQLPSVVGIGETDLGLLGRVGLGRKQRRAEPHVVAWNGWEYLVGAGVEHYAEPIERMDMRRLSDGPEVRALTYATCAGLLPPSAEPQRVALMIGLPVEVLANHELALRIRRELRSWLRATHTFSVDHTELTVVVEELQIMAQPAGAYFAWGFDDQGRWRRGQTAVDATVGICDIGFNTLDLFSIQGGRVQGRWTGGDNLGLSRAAELLIQSLHRSHGCRLSKHQADALLRQRNPALVLGGKTVDLRGMTTQALNASASRITSFLADTWGSGGQFGYTLFVGGGAAALRTELLHHYPKGIISAQPVLANAQGLARAGVRKLAKYAPVVIGLDPGFGGFKGVAVSCQ